MAQQEKVSTSKPEPEDLNSIRDPHSGRGELTSVR